MKSLMNQVGPPIYSLRGAQPRPLPGDAEARSSWRGSIVVLAVMFGWMALVFALAAITSSSDPNVEVPVEVSLGVIVTPADGWYSAAETWDPGPGAVTFQNSGAYVLFSVEEYNGTNDDLLTNVLAELGLEFEPFRVLPATATTVAGDLPGLTAVFSGVSDKWFPENEVVVVAYRGIGVIMWATAPAQQLARIQNDLDYMVDSLVVPR
jgi:hypothetical protein